MRRGATRYYVFMPRITDSDRSDLREAVELARTVVHRHPMEITGPIVTVLAAVERDVAVLTHLLEETA